RGGAAPADRGDRPPPRRARYPLSRSGPRPDARAALASRTEVGYAELVEGFIARPRTPLDFFANPVIIPLTFGVDGLNSGCSIELVAALFSAVRSFHKSVKLAARL